MKNRRLVLLSILISAVLVVHGWSLSKASKGQSLTQKEVIPIVEEISKTVTVPEGNSYWGAGQGQSLKRAVPVSPIAKLELELLGTAIGNIKDPIAFIKDLKTGRQRIYRLGSVIREARVMKISVGRVVFDRNGQRTVLTLSNRARAWSNIEPEAPAVVSVSGDRIVVSKRGALSQAQNIYKTLSKVKIKPHYQSDEVVGLMIEGIAEGSLIEAVGIHNKDVIKMVNNQKINSYQKALQVFHKVRNQKEIRVSLLRDGQSRTLSYRIDQ